MYILINTFYYFNLIPPVPLSLQNGIVAYNVEKQDDTFRVDYEQSNILNFWETYDKTFNYSPRDTAFVFTSIFTPTDLRKSVRHHWQQFSSITEQWRTSDEIVYDVIGAHRGGFRGSAYKTNVAEGKWRVNVITEESLVLRRIYFTIFNDTTLNKSQLNKTYFR